MSALFHNIGISRDFDAETIPQMPPASNVLTGSDESEPDHFTIRRLSLPLIEVVEVVPNMEGFHDFADWCKWAMRRALS